MYKYKEYRSMLSSIINIIYIVKIIALEFILEARLKDIMNWYANQFTDLNFN